MFKLPKFTVNWSVLFTRKIAMTLVSLTGCVALVDAVAHYSHAGAMALAGVALLIVGERNS
jgi:hypothetical protein